MPESLLDDLMALYAGSLDDPRRRELVQELHDPQSEAARAAAEIRRIARSEIDLAKIPGLEEIAAWEARREWRDGGAG
jgi:hypothetical protein